MPRSTIEYPRIGISPDELRPECCSSEKPSALGTSLAAIKSQLCRLESRVRSLEGTSPQSRPPPNNLKSIKELAAMDPQFSEAALRYHVHRAYARTTKHGEFLPANGLGEAGAVVRIGRRVLLDVDKFYAWVASNPEHG